MALSHTQSKWHKDTFLLLIRWVCCNI